MCSRIATAVLLCVVLAGCATNSKVALEPLDQLGDQLARTLCATSAPNIEPVPNRHVDGQIDRLETRRCSAGRSTLYRGATTSDPDGLPVAVEVVARGIGLPSYLEIGEPIGGALTALGVPHENGPSSVTYSLSMEGTGTATIQHAGGRIASVRWVWDLD